MYPVSGLHISNIRRKTILSRGRGSGTSDRSECHLDEQSSYRKGLVNPSNMRVDY
uniref:Uncharacterized protein n=1 Tax=Picea glauca TaxID=3330 RepID=A0A101LZH6_PICGL|nr:hypothetical protein ABT39_MTgene5238 [Picea glauca]